MMRKSLLIVWALHLATLASMGSAAEPAPLVSGGKTLEVLFIGNSFTGRHTLSQVVKTMVESGNADLRFNVTTVLYGGRRLVDHWRLGTQNFVNIARLTVAEEQATIAGLEQTVAKDPNDSYAKAAVERHRELLKTLEAKRKKWDLVVLQSYRDDLEGGKSLYVEYAPKFAELIKAQGGRVVLYETTPDTQNEKPLSAPPDRAPVLEKAKTIAALARRINATVVPMSLVALHCHTVRPDLTLRYVNDGHLNQTMAYLTACAFYAALCDRSPVGLPLDAVTDTRTLPGKRDRDRDGGPLTRKFSAKDREDLQRIAWEGLKQFQELMP